MDRLALNRMFKNGLMASTAVGLLLVGVGCRNQETRVPPVAHYSNDGMVPNDQGYPSYEATGGLPAGTGYDSVGSPYASSGAGPSEGYGAPGTSDANPYGSMAGSESSAGGYGNPYATEPAATAPASMPGADLPDAGYGQGGYDAPDMNAGAAPSIPDDMPYMSPIPGN